MDIDIYQMWEGHREARDVHLVCVGVQQIALWDTVRPGSTVSSQLESLEEAAMTEPPTNPHTSRETRQKVIGLMVSLHRAQQETRVWLNHN